MFRETLEKIHIVDVVSRGLSKTLKYINQTGVSFEDAGGGRRPPPRKKKKNKRKKEKKKKKKREKKKKKKKE